MTRCSDFNELVTTHRATLLWGYRADYRGGATCLNDNPQPGCMPGCVPHLAPTRRARSALVRGTPDAPIGPPATARVVSAGSARPPSTGGCGPACSGGRSARLL